MKRNIAGIAGLALIVGTLVSGLDRFAVLLDWSTAELVGYNVATIVMLVGGVWLMYWAATTRS